jgi:starch phosphorylase
MSSLVNAFDPFLKRTHIAYFSMEIALRPEIHTYSGGLGILAGDTARSAADLNLPMVFVSLVSRAGYVQQEIDAQGRQVTRPNPWEPEKWTQPLGGMVTVSIEGRDVWVRPWLYSLSCPLGHSVPVILLDTDVEQNSAEDRAITNHLYGGDEAYRLRQEIVLGIGGALMLRALGFSIGTYHLNEGHAALLTLFLLRQYSRAPREIVLGEFAYDHTLVRERCVFTTHTPIEAGHDRFGYQLVERLLGDYIDPAELRRLAGDDNLNMTRLALNLTGYVNGVAQRHAETTRQMFPGYDVRAITNGVHVATWAHASFARLFQASLPNWAHEPEVLARADQIPDEAIWAAHQEAKSSLVARVKATSGVEMRLDVPTIGFARRLTTYKRPDLLFTDLERLAGIARERQFQVVLAGLAHPKDAPGALLIEQIHRHIGHLAGVIPIAFLPNYDMTVAAELVAGVDIWLNTPLPPLEASGTSGMKAAVNGVLNLSVLDGWWAEACIDGTNGWAIGDGAESASGPSHATELYRKLAEVTLPLYYGDRARWIWMMKQSIARIASYFNSQRMMRRYATEAYIR